MLLDYLLARRAVLIPSFSSNNNIDCNNDINGNVENKDSSISIVDTIAALLVNFNRISLGTKPK